ncbi:COG4705 family protein [Candidatus Solirubrobacter pratensis]|uniref:COG4705 family protein n=1 Tax=Candidatus Solirubrobacter pratensis TaxID=1298857 RepID=UPI0003F8FE01
MVRSTARSRGPREPLAAKVPEITLLFWVIKVLTTGMGEAMSDFLGQKSVPIAGLIGVVGIWYALRLQLRATEYRAPVYWFAVMMVAVFGTMAADGVKDGAGLSYAVTTPFFAAVVAVIFWRWHRSEGTLSIHSITTRRRETYYWCAVLATFALGTAAGDMTAMTLNLGFFGSAVLFGALIAIPALAWWRGRLNPIVAFWAAYVITRPLGASFADWFGKPHPQTGLGLGDGTVSAIALVAFIALVAYAAVTKRDIQDRRPAPHMGRKLGVEAQPAES